MKPLTLDNFNCGENVKHRYREGRTKLIVNNSTDFLFIIEYNKPKEKYS